MIYERYSDGSNHIFCLGLSQYRWVIARRNRGKPQVITSGLRVMVGEPRFSIQEKEMEEGRASQEQSVVQLVLTLRAVRQQDAGVYMCWRRGQKPHPQIFLTVLDPENSEPEQEVASLTGPSTVHYGDSLVLNCTIRPARSTQVSWLRDGNRISLSDPSYGHTFFSSETELTFSIQVASLREDATFSCLLPAAPQSRKDLLVRVPVDSVDALSASPAPDTVQYGQILSLTCSASGHPAQVVWLKDGAILSPSAGRSISQTVVGQGAVQSTVTIQNFDIKDNGQYVCYYGGASRTLLINIEGRLGQLVGLEASPFIQGRPLVFSCRTQYSRDDEEADGLVELSTEQEPHNITRHDLVFSSPSHRHQGTYTCLTHVGQTHITVTMMVLPSLVSPLPPYLEVETGDDLSVSCQATGVPSPQILWLRLDNRGKWSEVSNQKVLFGKAAEPEDSGAYMCTASNSAGKVNATTQVAVVGETFIVIYKVIV
ncbi:Immunoglobulin I-set [Trinorchestia longiramus]|nr:Immunoglobulin I-set [Trinorchestia longiramus]